jgi:hypothetical protein
MYRCCVVQDVKLLCIIVYSFLPPSRGGKHSLVSAEICRQVLCFSVHSFVTPILSHFILSHVFLRPGRLLADHCHTTSGNDYPTPQPIKPAFCCVAIVKREGSEMYSACLTRFLLSD